MVCCAGKLETLFAAAMINLIDGYAQAWLQELILIRRFIVLAALPLPSAVRLCLTDRLK